jgi:sensor c-di-GMP phosphodiesterase-like protein
MPFVIALVIALVPLILGKWVLSAHGNAFGMAETEAVLTRYMTRAENVLSESIGALRDLERARHVSCSPDDRLAFIAAVNRSEYIRRIGVADENGFAMCLEPPPGARSDALLAPAAQQDRQVAIVVGEPAAVEAGAPQIVIGWRGQDGQRLVATISLGALDIDAGAAFLRGTRFVEILVDGGKRWASAGQLLSVRSDRSVVFRSRSDIFPIEGMIQVDRGAFYELVRSLDLTLTVASMASGLVLLGLAVWTTRRPETRVDDEFVLALRRKEFVPYYQPVMNIESGRIEGCELLVRWVRPDGTTVSPGRFMPYAETSGHVFEMTRQLMRQSVLDLGPLFSLHRGMKLSINLFAGHFDDRRIIEDTVLIFGGGPISYDQIVYEVTERYPLRDIEKARRVISEMHALGCRVALDDTGTGHGGLAYLQQLGIDIIKIDKMFIDAMGADLGASTIVDVLVELANSLGMGIVAEGVEREEQIEKLAEKGVTAAQGYVFAPPLPAKLFLELADALLTADDASLSTRVAA